MTVLIHWAFYKILREKYYTQNIAFDKFTGWKMYNTPVPRLSNLFIFFIIGADIRQDGAERDRTAAICG